MQGLEKFEEPSLTILFVEFAREFLARQQGCQWLTGWRGKRGQGILFRS
jgi:hypothetical protein